MEATDVRAAAAAIGAADALVVTAGAGMGVDSGLPDFRGDAGFWRAYPQFGKLGLRFAELANPRWFARDPTLAWGFYGHRRNLYRATIPHDGFAIVQRWAAARRHGGFVFTSNVDGQFAKAGWPTDRIAECHGAIEFDQCTADCGVGIFAAGADEIAIDDAECRAKGPLPACPRCGALARPNILMFGDGQWLRQRTAAQERRLAEYLGAVRRAGGKIAVIECGAGTAIPTVRQFGEAQQRLGAQLIRVNPREAEVPAGGIGLALGARAGLVSIDLELTTALGM